MLELVALNGLCVEQQVGQWVEDEHLPPDQRSGARIRSRTFGGTESGDGDDDDAEVDASDPLRLRQLGALSCMHCILSYRYLSCYACLAVMAAPHSPTDDNDLTSACCQGEPRSASSAPAQRWTGCPTPSHSR
jgi:hypothetical protein